MRINIIIMRKGENINRNILKIKTAGTRFGGRKKNPGLDFLKIYLAADAADQNSVVAVCRIAPVWIPDDVNIGADMNVFV